MKIDNLPVRVARRRAMVGAVLINALAFVLTTTSGDSVLVLAWSYLLHEFAITTTITLRARRIELLFLDGVYFANPPMAQSRYFRWWSETALTFYGMLALAVLLLGKETLLASRGQSLLLPLTSGSILAIGVAGVVFVASELASLGRQYEGDLRHASGAQLLGQAAAVRVLLVLLVIFFAVQPLVPAPLLIIAMAKTLADFAGIAAQPWARD